MDEDRFKNITNLEGVEATLSAVLLHTKIKMNNFLNLKSGDTICSEKRIDMPIDICVNKRKKFTAKPGVSGKKRAFQVVEVHDDIIKETTND